MVVRSYIVIGIIQLDCITPKLVKSWPTLFYRLDSCVFDFSVIKSLRLTNCVIPIF